MNQKIKKIGQKLANDPKINKVIIEITLRDGTQTIYRSNSDLELIQKEREARRIAKDNWRQKQNE